jgi:hypothetical protein
MGEYAVRKSDGERVKIGTCEEMFYLRYEDRNKVSQLDGSLNTSTELNLFWRLPFPDEDNVQIGQYENHVKGLRLYKQTPGGCEDFRDETTPENPGSIQVKHESGLLFCVPCYHGEKLPDINGIRFHWNGRSWFYELASIKNTPDGIFPIVRCRHCGQMWRYSWDEVLPYVHGEMKTRLEVYNQK